MATLVAFGWVGAVRRWAWAVTWVGRGSNIGGQGQLVGGWGCNVARQGR